MRSHLRRIIGWGVTIGILLGMGLAYAGLRAPSGYAAAYAFGGAWVLSIAWMLVAGALVVFRRTRPFGYAAAACGASLLLAFYIAFWGGYKAGLYDWWGDNKVTIPATEPR